MARFSGGTTGVLDKTNSAPPSAASVRSATSFAISRRYTKSSRARPSFLALLAMLSPSPYGRREIDAAMPTLTLRTAKRLQLLIAEVIRLDVAHAGPTGRPFENDGVRAGRQRLQNRRLLRVGRGQTAGGQRRCVRTRSPVIIRND